jgi:hypothetical protein
MNDTDESLTISVSPGEILQPGETIEIRSKRAIARRFAQSAVRLSRHGAPIPITVRVGARGRLLSVSTADLEPGPYELDIRELLGSRGERLVDRRAIPFAIVPISGDLPAGSRVEHAVRIVVGDLAVERLAPGGRSDRGTCRRSEGRSSRLRRGDGAGVRPGGIEGRRPASCSRAWRNEGGRSSGASTRTCGPGSTDWEIVTASTS